MKNHRISIYLNVYHAIIVCIYQTQCDTYIYCIARRLYCILLHHVCFYAEILMTYKHTFHWLIACNPVLFSFIYSVYYFGCYNSC